MGRGGSGKGIRGERMLDTEKRLNTRNGRKEGKGDVIGIREYRRGAEEVNRCWKVGEYSREGK